jgi:glycerol kinase
LSSSSRPPALLVLDEGTSSCRAALYRDGVRVAQSKRAVDIVFPAPGRAEQDAKSLLEAAVAVLEDVAGAIHDAEPAVLGIANQRSTVVLWDRETGRPCGPALSWRDSRARDEADQLGAAVPDLASRTGLPASAHYGAPKIAWALRHWPEAAAAASARRLCVGPVSTWLAWKLSGGQSFAVDPTNAQRMLLLDLRRLDWDDKLVRASGVPPSALPQVLPTDGVFGEAHVGRHRIPIRAMLGDQQAVLLGLHSAGMPGGSADDGPDSGRAETVAVQLGTGGFVLKDVGSDIVAAAGLLSGIARADANKARRYLVEGTVNSAGSALDRLRDLGLLQDGDDIDRLCESATAPAIVVPAWAGLGAPWWSSGARAAFMGWDESTTRADIVAGTVRGVAFLVADILDFMSAAELRTTRLELSGTVSRQRAMAQAIADATARPVRVRDNPEATLEGLAHALAEASGGVAPRLSLEAGESFEPRRGLEAERAAFAEARSAAMRLGRPRQT